MSNKTKKQPIPKALRRQVWKTHIGNLIYGNCFVCNRYVENDNFDCAHVIAEKNGGRLTIDNLRVTCKPCNTSCGTMNLFDFKKLFNKEDIDVVKPSETKMVDIINNMTNIIREQELIELKNKIDDQNNKIEFNKKMDLVMGNSKLKTFCNMDNIDKKFRDLCEKIINDPKEWKRWNEAYNDLIGSRKVNMYETSDKIVMYNE